MARIKDIDTAMREVDRRNRRKAMKNFALFITKRGLPAVVLLLVGRKTYQIATK